MKSQSVRKEWSPSIHLVIMMLCSLLKFIPLTPGDYFLTFHASVPAVKFGRMSKKQREKVEDEVRYHKSQMRAALGQETSPDSSVYESSTPTSPDAYSA